MQKLTPKANGCRSRRRRSSSQCVRAPSKAPSQRAFDTLTKGSFRLNSAKSSYPEIFGFTTHRCNVNKADKGRVDAMNGTKPSHRLDGR